MSARARGTGSRLLWITDPWDTLDHPRDTTLRLAEECLVEGETSWWCDVKTVRWEGDAVRLDACPIEGVYPGRAAESFKRGAFETLSPSDFTQLHYRTDPPVDLAYLHPLQLVVLDLGRHPKGSELVNPAQVLFSANEKTQAFAVEGLAPPSCVSSLWDRLAAFGRREGRTVLKPLHEAQSHGVELLDWHGTEGAEKARLAVESATAGFTRPVLLQRFLPAISEGETRLWFLDGKLLSWARKLPARGDFRVNIDGGSRLVATELTAADRKVGTRVGKLLASLEIRLAAVDLIEGLVTDFNFTSPGLIRQMEGVLGENLAKPIVRALLGKS